MDTLVYLDIDDEVTTAAARIRDAEPGLVVLVVPSGSRIATSRINFRLLAREAEERRRQLAIVAPDAATRAMAEAAGLTVYGTVGQYEDAARARREEATGAVAAAAASAAAVAAIPEPAGTEPPGVTDARPTDAEPAAADELPVVVKPEDVAGEVTTPAAGPPPSAEVTTPVAVTAAAAAAVAAASVASAAPAAPAGPRSGGLVRDAGMASGGPIEPGSAPSAGASAPSARATAAATTQSAGPAPTLPVRGGVRSIGGGISRRAVAIAGAVGAVGLAGLLAAVLVLPSATITIVPLTTTVGPVAVSVRADPGAAGVDVEAAIVPAQRPEIALAASGTFPATGRQVDETRATGTVTFTSKDPTRTNRVPAGSIVSTTAGIGFRTLAAVTVPKAKIEGLTIIPGRINVRVEAVKGGPEGNVAANAITIIPAGEDPVLTAVTNAADTGGGTRTETPEVTAKDVQAAVAALESQLDEQLTAALADPANIPPPLTAYPETASRSAAAPSVDPESLVGQEVESFDLSLTATGSVTAVDLSLVGGVAEAQVLAAASPDADLIEGSLEVDLGVPAAEGVIMVFPTTGTAAQTARLDPAAIEEEALGKTVDEATADLARYGEVTITTWPDWVTTVPDNAGRVEVVIATAPATTPGPGASPSPAPLPGSTS